jgi:hypothetical protein
MMGTGDRVDDPLAHLLEAGLDLSRDRRYVVERELGRGSMGVVYSGRDLLLDRPVAIKVMAGSMVGDSDLRRYFEREARAAGRLSHRNVVTVHDVGYDARGFPFVVMELLRGRDLRQVSLAMVPLALDRRLAIILQVLAGLAHAHSAGVVHRDVKPANVFITDEGIVKLLDFGIARIVRSSRNSRGNSSDAVMGTTDYMSPEHVLGGEVDGRSDLFSCGALLFELLTGSPPFHAESFVTTAYRVVHEEPDYTLLPASARGLEPVLRRVLAKSRDDRYASATDFATEIGLAMGVGVAPETIQPAPAWTIPLPRLVPVREPEPTAAVRDQQWEKTAMGPPDHSPVRPRWPLGPHEEDEGAHAPRRLRRRIARMVWATAGAVAAVSAFAVGMARWRTVATPAPAPVAEAVAPPAQQAQALPAPAPTVPAVEVPAPTPSSESVSPPPVQEPAEAPAAAVPLAAVAAPVKSERAPAPAGTTSFWSVASPPPAGTGSGAAQSSVLGALPPAPAPSASAPAQEPPQRILSGRWMAFITDDSCREKGAVSDHGQCLESCLRRGRQPLIAIDGQLYKLIGLDRIRGLHDRRVVVEGQLNLDRRTFTVSSGAPER